MEPVDRSTIWPYDERGEPGQFYYSRYGSPTVARAEARLGELDGGEALLFPSGSGAATAPCSARSSAEAPRQPTSCGLSAPAPGSWPRQTRPGCCCAD